MSLPIILLVLFALLLVGLLAWALRPPTRPLRPALDVFEALSRPRHCSRISHVVQALQPEDTEYLRIALNYLDQLQKEFEELLEISRVLAVMSPKVIGIQEMERWKLSVAFAVNCVFLKWKLRLGLRPFSGFALLSNMATDMARQLDMATTQIAEAAVRGTKNSALGQENMDGL
jgi:hypothetical protein